MRQGVFVLYVTYYNKCGYYCVIVLYAVDRPNTKNKDYIGGGSGFDSRGLTAYITFSSA